MSLQKKIDELINKKEKVALEESKRLIDIFRKYIKSFNRIVKSYSSHKGHEEFKGGAYAEISKLLAEEGITKRNGENISTAQIAKCLRQVRAEFGLLEPSKKSRKGISSLAFDFRKKVESENNLDNREDRWVETSERLAKSMDTWSEQDEKDYYELEKIQIDGNELTYEQSNCYDKLLRKIENNGK
ncbi:MAG: hypothetical protein H7336_05500 [Bacteriovorax sp.]|nr:hypothetical protein [Bacteriovorax sp.]